jgi:hypothetical protein
LQNNGSHHPAREGEATKSKSADRVLGVHGFVTPTSSFSVESFAMIRAIHLT